MSEARPPSREPRVLERRPQPRSENHNFQEAPHPTRCTHRPGLLCASRHSEAPFVDRGGVVHVHITDPAAEGSIRNSLRAELDRGNRGSATIVAHAAQFSFSDLREWSNAVLPLLRLPGVVWSEIDEVHNRIQIGLENLNASGDVLQAAAALGVPRAAVRFQKTTRAVLFDDLHSSRIRPFIAGVRTEGYISQPGYNDVKFPCTYGANVIKRGDVAGPFYMVTASHCTQVTPPFGSWINAALYQPSVPTFQSDSATYWLGIEVNDPAGWTGGICPAGAICRNADAALVSITAHSFGDYVDQGYIARPSNGPMYPPTLNGSITVDGSNPRLRIDGVMQTLFPGDVVQKIGETTGWTAGVLGSNCRNKYVQDKTNITQDYYLLCQLVDTLGAGPGDSGAPAFYQGLDGKYYMAGTLWGGEPPSSGTYSSVAYISPWSYVSYDLTGSQTILSPAASDMSISISGDACVTEDGTYSWNASASGGDGGYSYYWELSFNAQPWEHAGSNLSTLRSYLFGTSGSSGTVWVRVTVQSGGSAKTSQTFQVTERFGGFC